MITAQAPSKAITKHCISCHQDGHTYLECPRVPFGAVFAAAFGLPDLRGDREQAAANLREIERGKAVPR